MKSIINVRRSSICWRGRRELVTDVRKPEKSWLWRHCRRRAIYRLLRSPSQIRLWRKPKTQINRRWTLPAFSRWWDAYRSLPGDFSPKVRTLWHCSRLRSVALYLWLIGWISARQSTVVAISGSLPGADMVSSSIRLTAWLQNLKKRARNGQEIDVWAESPRLSPLCYLHHRSPVMGC